MSTALTVVDQGMTAEQMKLIKSVIAPTATADELTLFLYRCKSLGLDPLKPGQIYFIKYGQGPGTIVVGIEGFRTRAHRTGKFGGIRRDVVRDENGKCIGAWCEIYRKDWPHPAREEVPLSEYNTGKGNWAKMPETMIKKVAEAAALRMAFPDELGGVYAAEEMEKVADEKGVRPQQPGENDGSTVETVYRAPKGKFDGRTIDDIVKNFSRQVIEDHMIWCENNAKQKGTSIPAWQRELFEMLGQRLGMVENGPLDPDELETYEEGRHE